MRYLLGVFLVSVSLIALEIGLTRIFSAMIWYHLSFMAISLSMLGFSLGGILLLLFPSIVAKERNSALAPLSMSFAFVVAVGTLYVYLQPTILHEIRQVTSRGPNAAALVYFLFLLGIFILAFVFSGLTISTAIARRADDVSRVYFANLTGSGFGCLLIIALLTFLGAFKAMLVIILLTAIGSLCFLERPRSFSSSSFLVGCALILAVILPLFIADRQTVFTRSLFTRRDVTDQNRIYRKWNTFSCVDFYKPEKGSTIHYDGETADAVYEGLWGLSPRYHGKMLDPIKVIIDSWAITSINRVEKDTLDLDIYDYLPTNLAYQLKNSPKVLIMGAGGGIDVLSALHYRSPRIRAVEINPAIVEAVKTRFSDYAGNIYGRHDVDVIVGEGRHWINKDTEAYDLIQLSGVDTLSGAQASSYSFSESYLYTVEAFEEYLQHLEPDGIVTFLRFSFKKPREMLRLFSTAVEALERSGVRDPARHLFVVHSNVLIFANLMIKMSPFTPDEVKRLEAFIKEKGFRVLYAPYRPGRNEFHQLIDADNRQAFFERYPFRIEPVADDNPFFFNYTKFSDVIKPPSEKIYWLYWVGQTILFYGLFLVLLLGLPFLVLPAITYRIKRRLIPGRNRFILYFLCLGLGFMFVEILLMQRFTLFLGQPIYSLALILFCLLVFAGLGSFFSGRIPVQNNEQGRRKLFLSFGLLVISLLVVYLLTGPVFQALLKAHIFTRIAVSVCLLTIPSFLMGIPFPLGIRLADCSAKPMVPWGWAVNGYASVAGSFLSVILGMSFGFIKVYFVALGIYCLAGWLLASLSRRLAET